MTTPPLVDVHKQYREVLERFYASPMWMALDDAEREAECRDCKGGEAECLRCRP